MRCPSIICFICFLACFRLSIHARTHQTYDSAPDSIYHLGIEKAKIGRFSDAKDCFLKYLSLEDSLSESEYYYVTEGIAYCYNQLGIKDSVLFYNEDYLFPPIEKSSLYIADSLYRSAYNHIHTNEFDDAIHQIKECISQQQRIIGDTHLLTARSKDLLSYAYALTNSYQQSIENKSEALRIYSEWYDINNPIVIGTTLSLADLYDYIGEYEKAYTITNKCIQSLSTSDENYFNIRFRISRYLSVMGNYSEAVKYEKETQTIPDIDTYVNLQSKYNLCDYYIALGNMEEAFSTINDAIDLCEKKNLSDEEHAIALNLKANLYSVTGDYINAIKTGNEALRIRESLFSLHRDLAMSYNNLARYHSFLGLYSEAISLQEKCMHQYVDLGDDNTPEMAAALNNYSDYFAHQGKIDVAIQYQKQGIQILESIFGRKHPDCAISINNLSKLYALKNDFDAAIELCEEVLDIRKSIFGEFHPDVAVSYVNMSSYYLGKNDYQKAIEYNERSLGIYEKIIGTNNADYARGMQYMASIYQQSKEYDTAISYIQKAVEYYKSRFGVHSPQYLECIKSLAVLYKEAGDEQTSLSFISEVMEMIDDYTLSSFGCMTSTERAQFWEKNKDWYYQQLPRLAVSINTPKANTLLYNSLLTSKGLLLSTDIEIEKLIQSSNDSILVSDWERLGYLKSALNYEYNSTKEERTNNIENLSNTIKELELDVMERIKAYGDISQKFKTKWSDVRAVLEDDEIAVEFCAIPYPNDTVKYVALLIAPEFENPILIDLFEESTIEWPNKNDVVGDLDSYNDHIWKPIFTHLKNDVKNVYFSPSGKLHIAAIEYSTNFTSDKLSFYRLTSTRELISLKGTIPQLTSAVIYGGLIYDTESDTQKASDVELIRDVVSQNSFNYLPFTYQEAESIDSLLSANNYKTIIFTGDKGTEDTFYGLGDEDPNIIHIATHGFYYSSEADIDWVSRIISKYPPQQLTNEDASLCRTGLILSKAKNQLFVNRESVNEYDGILTAKEISQVNLHGLYLTILSACKTAQGDVNGDGVFGLQRGFKKAGAQSLLMSLWSVNDQATLYLMEHFYQHLLQGFSFHQSLILAQKDLRTCNDGVFDHPAYWAAFILLDSL